MRQTICLRPERKQCLRCGYNWSTAWKWVEQGTKPSEPKRCAKCRSPLWNKPKTHSSGPRSALELARDAEEARAADLSAKPKAKPDHSRAAEKSRRLHR